MVIIIESSDLSSLYRLLKVTREKFNLFTTIKLNYLFYLHVNQITYDKLEPMLKSVYSTS